MLNRSRFAKTYLGTGYLDHLTDIFTVLLRHLWQPGPPLAGKYCYWLTIKIGMTPLVILSTINNQKK